MWPWGFGTSTFLLSFAILIFSVLGSHAGPSRVTLPDGLVYVDLVEGTGPSPHSGQTLVTSYVGRFLNGARFDSSADHSRPFSFQIGKGQLIKGWEEGLLTMKVGGKRKLIIPSSLAYGPMGLPPIIPPDTTLIFEVELLGIIDSAQQGSDPSTKTLQ